MSEILIVALLMVPVFIVVAILNNSNRKRKKKAQDRLTAYLHEVAGAETLSHSFQKQLVHQTIVLDEKAAKVFVVDHRGAALSHEVYSLAAIKNLKVLNLKQTLPAETAGQKPETFTTEIGVELLLDKTGERKFLVAYDHVEHNIFQLAGFEKEAAQLLERIANAQKGQFVEL